MVICILVLSQRLVFLVGVDVVEATGVVLFDQAGLFEDEELAGAVFTDVVRKCFERCIAAGWVDGTEGLGESVVTTLIGGELWRFGAEGIDEVLEGVDREEGQVAGEHQPVRVRELLLCRQDATEGPAHVVDLIVDGADCFGQWEVLFLAL